MMIDYALRRHPSSESQLRWSYPEWRPTLVFAKVLFVAAALIGLTAAPVAVSLFRHWFPTTWPDELPKYQALVAALIALFAASLASIGVWLTIQNQRQIADDQLAAQRREQDRARGFLRQQIASAFIGEIGVVIDELRHEMVRPVLEKALRDMESTDGSSEVPVVTVQIGKHLGRYYESNPANVGLFHGTIPEELTRFYSTIEEIRLNLDWYTNAVNAYTDQRKTKMSPSLVLSLIRGTLSNIDTCLTSGPPIIESLKQIRDANLD